MEHNNCNIQKYRISAWAYLISKSFFEGLSAEKREERVISEPLSVDPFLCKWKENTILTIVAYFLYFDIPV